MIMKTIPINYHNRKFTPATNSENGEVSGQTIFHYQQDHNVLHAHYSGGEVLQGHLIGTIDEEGRLDFVYHHLNQNKEIKTGKCHSEPEILEDGRIRLHESWQWTSGDHSSGVSVVEEINSF